MTNLDNCDIESVRDKVVLITGGSGSLGNAIIKKISNYVKKIIIFSRDELKHANMIAEYNIDKLRFLIGDVKDKDRLKIALKNVDICIHAACMKRVESCTYNPIEAVKNNIIGSLNVLEACLSNNVEKVLMVSTDKSCNPATLYGGTKFISEQLFINGNNYSSKDSNTIFFATRYGNVFASNGSIRVLFEKQIKDKGYIEITDSEMTRFFMSMGEAVDLNLFAINNALGGEIYVPKLKAAKIIDFAKTFFPDAEIRIIGVRGYEKIHEELISNLEIRSTVDCGKYYKILPPSIRDKEMGWDRDSPQEKTIIPFKYSSDVVEKFTKNELLSFDK